jgi:hypothetical protein
MMHGQQNVKFRRDGTSVNTRMIAGALVQMVSIIFPSRTNRFHIDVLAVTLIANDHHVHAADFGSALLITNDTVYRDADKSLARPTSRCILFNGENISFDASLVIYVNSTNIPPIMIINTIYEHQNLLSL